MLAYLLTLHRRRGGSIVVVSPTLQPQGMISHARLLDRLHNPLTGGAVLSRGHLVSLDRARCSFVSSAPGANARGETASLLLVCNEAQDVPPDRWDSVFDPMAASTNATTVFMGTVWTSRTLLARQMRYLQELEAEDGRRRVFKAAWDRVAQDVPAYGERVQARIRQLGRNHPFVRTEYFLEELSGEGGLFPSAVRARMRGDHPARQLSEAGKTYALLVDVGGEEHDRGADLTEEALGSRRDATALTVVEVDTSTLADPTVLAPTYRVVSRRTWTGAGQPELLREIVHLATRVWEVKRVVVDATGVGAGLAAFLSRALGPGAVIPFVFTRASKSELGWSFLHLCSSGRFLDHLPDASSEQNLF
ncbi:MAG: hypothetical protein M3281_09100, partial [Chloroflexota bacterium]|nr:hypothetical protein [Chloroflexota bacterium]